jgi:hypothetical protein
MLNGGTNRDLFFAAVGTVTTTQSRILIRGNNK